MSEISETFNFMPLGEAIKNAREKNGLTREQLAEQLGIPDFDQLFNQSYLFCRYFCVFEILSMEL